MGRITNTVSVTANEPDPIPANNRAEAITLVVEPPQNLVSDGVVSYAVAEPKIFYHTLPICAAAADGAAGPDREGFETIGRVATYGSPVRSLRRETRACAGTGEILSNLVADELYVYWVGAAGLMRLSVNANPGDSPGLLNTAVRGSAELAQDGANLYANVLGSASSIYRVRKAGGASALLRTVAGGARSLSADGEFLYWLRGTDLQRYNLATGALETIATGVTGYRPEGERPCAAGGCVTKFVFIAQGPRVVRFNNVDGSTSAAIYTSEFGDAEIYDLVSDGDAIFLLEERPTPVRSDTVVRSARFGGDSVPLYKAGSGGVHAATHLDLVGKTIYWQYSKKLISASKASDFPLATNLRVTGWSLTQGVQTKNNTLQPIEGRRTFVRVFVQSEGNWDEPGVTAHLYRLGWSSEVIAGPLEPINPNKTITVKTAPDRLNLNDSFLFELPLDWVTGALILRADLNPYHSPVENSYSDNSTSGLWIVRPSPRLETVFVAFGYAWNGVEYWPRADKDLDQALSWVRRVYPVASTPGGRSDPGQGLRADTMWIFDSALGGHVNRTSQYCYDNYTAKGQADLLEYCASYYTNGQLGALRVQYGIPESVFMYGMISDGLKFPRGQADGPGISSGPTGPTSGWDTDGSYGDWYAGHEVGHTVGRGHVLCRGDEAGPDLKFPYAGGRIGPGDGTVEGFDGGDAALGIPRAVYADSIWRDLMTYCDYQWISDLNYECIYSYLTTGHNSGNCATDILGARTVAASSNAREMTAPRAGDWLQVYGLIFSDADKGNISYVRRLSGVAHIPALTPGSYRLQLLGSGGAVLAEHAFTPYPADGVPGQLNFNQVVPFMVGTSRVRLVNSSGRTLSTAALSPHPPVVSNVALQGAANPVSGVVTLAWTASDADGDPLHFDVLYSRDSGATFLPFHLNFESTSVPVDTSLLGGSGQAVLRVVANDGSQSAQADSAPFVMATKPPQVQILSPADGTHVHYGQLVNLTSEARDLQDGAVADAALVWSDERGTLGSGPFLALTDLPVGTVRITLMATNTAGLSASASVTVTVDDDLSLPGPTLSVGPQQIGWQVAVGTTQLQTAALSISNTGDGVLTYTVGGNASWLSVTPASGTAPAVVALTADPTGLAGGTVRTTTLTITASGGAGQPDQIVTVPVRLVVGSAGNDPGSRAKAYLPLIRR